MISIKNISFSYGEKSIFKDFSLEIKNGDRICLFGQSGCGKTTLLRLILGLEKPQNGSLLKAENLKFSAVFQESRLLPFKTVIENITIIGADQDTALAHLSALGLEEYKNKYPSELSGGMKRRAAIARALSAQYDVIVLDEPFSGLDSENITAAAEHINKSINGKTLVLVTHSEDEAKLLNANILKL